MADRDPVGILRDLSDHQARRSETPARLARDLKHALEVRSNRTNRSRRVAVGLGVASALTLISIGAAALIFGGQPDRPEAGTVCRAAAALEASALVVPTGPDPIAACRNAWTAGNIPAVPAGEVPPLRACIGPNGAIEVFPNLDRCGDLRLETAATSLQGDAAAVADLQAWIAESVNLAECRSTRVVVTAVEDQLVELGLDGWTVAVSPGFEDSTCAKAQVESTEHSVLVAGL